MNLRNTDCEKALVWLGGIKEADRLVMRRPGFEKRVAGERAGEASAATEGEARERRDEAVRISRLSRGRTVLLVAIVGSRDRQGGEKKRMNYQITGMAI